MGASKYQTHTKISYIIFSLIRWTLFIAPFYSRQACSVLYIVWATSKKIWSA